MKRKKLRSVIILALAVIFAVSLGACGSSGGGNAGGSAAPAPASAGGGSAVPAATNNGSATTSAIMADVGTGAPRVKGDDTGYPTTPAPAKTGSNGTAQIAAVFGSGHTDGINDKAFIQDCWSAITRYGDENNKTYAYYQPVDDSKQSFLDTYNTAIQNGAEVIISIGNEPTDATNEATWENPKVKFVSIEQSGFQKIAPNHYAILVNVTDAGWLAGVSAVREGYTNLGIVPCTAIPPVDMWTWGWLQGINYAAEKYGVKGITAQSHYPNIWAASPEIQSLAAGWYNSGVQVIQCNTAGGNTSVIAAATAANKPVYGSDKDEYDEGPTVVTSEVAFRQPLIYDALVSAYNGTFPGGAKPNVAGVSFMPGIESDAVGLVMSHNRFKNYTQAMYDQDYAALKNDTDGVRSNMISVFAATKVDDMWAKVTPKNITFKNIP